MEDEDEWERPELSDDDHAAWWKAVGQGDLQQLLYWRWDPIQVADHFPATKGEYDAYVGPLLTVLRKGGGVGEVFFHLQEVEETFFEGQLSGQNTLRNLSYLIVGWYEESLARWVDRPGDS